MDADKDNAAARLVRILEKAKTLEGTVACQRAWAQILNCDARDTSQIYIALGTAMQLPSEVAELVKEYFPSQMKNIPLWKEPVERAFSKQDLKATLSTFTEHIGAHSVAHLGVLSDLISTKIDGKLLSSDELNGLKSQFNKLLDDITVADINNDIKAYLTRELEKLIRLIREYTIFGAEPILKQIDCIFGHVVRNKKYHSFFRDEALGKTLFDGLAAMANVLTVSIGLPQLSVVIDTLLPKQ